MSFKKDLIRKISATVVVVILMAVLLGFAIVTLIATDIFDPLLKIILLACTAALSVAAVYFLYCKVYETIVLILGIKHDVSEAHSEAEYVQEPKAMPREPIDKVVKVKVKPPVDEPNILSQSRASARTRHDNGTAGNIQSVEKQRLVQSVETVDIDKKEKMLKARQEQIDKQAEMERQAEEARKIEAVKRAEMARKVEIARQEEQARRAELAAQAKMAKQSQKAKRAQLVESAMNTQPVENNKNIQAVNKAKESKDNKNSKIPFNLAKLFAKKAPMFTAVQNEQHSHRKAREDDSTDTLNAVSEQTMREEQAIKALQEAKRSNDIKAPNKGQMPAVKKELVGVASAAPVRHAISPEPRPVVQTHYKDDTKEVLASLAHIRPLADEGATVPSAKQEPQSAAEVNAKQDTIAAKSTAPIMQKAAVYEPSELASMKLQRGRPPKEVTQARRAAKEAELAEYESLGIEPPKPRRGRPPKVRAEAMMEVQQSMTDMPQITSRQAMPALNLENAASAQKPIAIQTEAVPAAPVYEPSELASMKLQRGRPPKEVTQARRAAKEAELAEYARLGIEPPKPRRGRPPKSASDK